MQITSVVRVSVIYQQEIAFSDGVNDMRGAGNDMSRLTGEVVNKVRDSYLCSPRNFNLI